MVLKRLAATLAFVLLPWVGLATRTQAPPISHELKDVPLRVILDAIATHADLELAVSPRVDLEVKASSVLQEVAFEKALSVLGRLNGFQARVCGDVLVVFPEGSSSAVRVID